MEKVIEISGKETKFKASATTTIRYRKMFGHDLIQDLNKIRGTKDYDCRCIRNLCKFCIYHG